MGKTPAQEMARKLKITKKKMAEEKKKMKVNEDKAFGLKNQKGAKQALNVDRLRAAAARQGKTNRQLKEEEERAAAANLKRKMKKLGLTEADLLTGQKAVVTKKGLNSLAAGTDPKTVLCGFFKAGKCKKGKKCKFSHDLNIENKTKGKIDIYADPRKTDTMDKWDQAKLEKVVEQKDKMVRQNVTQIVCKYFIDAIEQKKYGWFWKCENGKDCMYQHRLPKGFVLKSDLKREEDEKAKITIEEQIELDRAKLDKSKCTDVTEETFKAWKEKQKLKKAEDTQAEIKAVKKKKGPKGFGMTGRTLFAYDPSLFVDDDDAAGEDELQYEEEEEEGEGDKVEETETKVWN